MSKKHRFYHTADRYSFLLNYCSISHCLRISSGRLPKISEEDDFATGIRALIFRISSIAKLLIFIKIDTSELLKSDAGYKNDKKLVRNYIIGFLIAQ